MITGAVDANLEARVPVFVQDASGHFQQTETVIDSGFTGYLTLPTSVVASLGLPWRGHGHGVLADGSVTIFDVYTATVLWDGHPRILIVDAVAVESLLGMASLHRHEVRIQVIDRGSVTIEALP
jgi:clan AA aspartic protease